jgi:tetratricopeptide (TPR) repeat protein
LDLNLKSVNRQQIIFVSTAVIAVFLLFFFGRTVADHSGHNHAAPSTAAANSGTLDFPTMLGLAKKRLNAQQLEQVTQWENAVVRGNVKDQQIQTYRTLSRFWMDTIGAFVPYVKYMGEAAKLESSEKNLTFAAHLLLAELQKVEEDPLKMWMAKEAKELFEKALELNPNNDSTKVGLGSTYFFGAAAANEPPMKGIGLIREVTEKNPNHVFAQYMLGVGSSVSGQWPKAIERFTKVAELEPGNLEVQLRLADIYERTGDKAAAKKWYQRLLQTIKQQEQKGKMKPDPEMVKQIEAHVKSL